MNKRFIEFFLISSNILLPSPLLGDGVLTNAAADNCCVETNCPPQMPCCDPCDCIMDFYPPIVDGGWHGNAEFLYWNVQQKATTFVVTPEGFSQLFPPSNVVDSLGKYRSAKFDWNPGFRIGLGYGFDRDAWDLFGQYTYYYTNGANSYVRPDSPNLYLNPTLRAVNLSAFPLGLLSTKSHVNFHYQIADLLVSRRFIPGCQIIFNLFTGATGAWIEEFWKVVEEYGVTTKTSNRWKLQAGGIRAGADANWHIGNGFGIYNKISVATVVGSYTNHRLTNVLPTQIGFTNPIRDTKDEDTWVVPQTQLELGLNWNHRFCNFDFGLQAAFEINTWYDLYQFHQDEQDPSAPNNDKVDYVNRSNINLWGFTASANVHF